MTLLTEPCAASPSTSVGIEDGDCGVPSFEIAVLDLPVEWMRACEVCDREERFVAVLECAAGLVGFCSGCGNESVSPWTRTNGEVV